MTLNEKYKYTISTYTINTYTISTYTVSAYATRKGIPSTYTNYKNVSNQYIYTNPTHIMTTCL